MSRAVALAANLGTCGWIISLISWQNFHVRKSVKVVVSCVEGCVPIKITRVLLHVVVTKCFNPLCLIILVSIFMLVKVSHIYKEAGIHRQQTSAGTLPASPCCSKGYLCPVFDMKSNATSYRVAQKNIDFTGCFFTYLLNSLKNVLYLVKQNL